MKRHSLVLVLGLAMLIVGVGVMYLVDPGASMKAADIHISSPPGRTEIRGMYGGLHMGLGLFMLRCARASEPSPALLLAGLVFGCVALGRTLGFAVEGEADVYNAVVTAIEIGISSLCWLLWRRERDSG